METRETRLKVIFYGLLSVGFLLVLFSLYLSYRQEQVIASQNDRILALSGLVEEQAEVIASQKLVIDEQAALIADQGRMLAGRGVWMSDITAYLKAVVTGRWTRDQALEYWRMAAKINGWTLPNVIPENNHAS